MRLHYALARDKLGDVLLRRFFPALAGLCVLTSVAHAQTTPPAVTLIPGDALGVPQTVQGVPLQITPALPPTIETTPSVVNSPVTFALSIYWIDALSPEKQLFQKAAPEARVAKQSEFDSLANLMEQERATHQPLPTVTGEANVLNVLPFGRAKAVITVPPRDNSVDPNFNFGAKQPYKIHPIDPLNINPGDDTAFNSIDPGIFGNKPMPPTPALPLNPGENLTLPQDNLTMMPIVAKDGHLTMLVNGAGFQPILLPLKSGDTIMLSGSAKDWGLKPPSPRFDTFVLMVQPNIQTKQP